MENKNLETLISADKHSRNKKYKTAFLPVIGVLLFAPFTAEYIIGYLDVTGDFGLMFLYLLFFGPLYGGAALIIREFTRRAGLGWLTIIILAFAFGLFQAGMIDHGLFNPSFQDIEYWQDLRDPTYLPFLGISAYQAVDFISGHVIWSIAVPIVTVETFFTTKKKDPWLSNVSLTIFVLLYLVASAFIFQDQVSRDQFLPSFTQFIVTGMIVIVLIVAAFKIGKYRMKPTNKVAPKPLFVGTTALFLLSLNTLIELIAALLGITSSFTTEWSGVILRSLSLSLLAFLVFIWSKQKGWNSLHLFALAGGAMLTRNWIAFLIQPLGDVSSTQKLFGNSIFLLGTILLILFGKYIIQKQSNYPKKNSL